MAKRGSAAFQAICWRGAMIGLLVLVVLDLWAPITEIKLSGAGGGLVMAGTVAEADAERRPGAC